MPFVCSPGASCNRFDSNSAGNAVQVLEDLEALVKLLTTRAHDSEQKLKQLQHGASTANLAAESAKAEQQACSKQLETSKKEAATAKRVCSQKCPFEHLQHCTVSTVQI